MAILRQQSLAEPEMGVGLVGVAGVALQELAETGLGRRIIAGQDEFVGIAVERVRVAAGRQGCDIRTAGGELPALWRFLQNVGADDIALGVEDDGAEIAWWSAAIQPKSICALAYPNISP